MKAIDAFRDKYYFLSNMFPCRVVYNGVLFSCAEAAFQAAKCFSRASEFAGLDGYAAKRLGRKVELRPDWEDVKLRVMREIVAAKFTQNPDQNLFQRLKFTGDAELIEGNTWNDRFWGVCNGKGENHLGKILMELRSKPQPWRFPRANEDKAMARLQELWDARTGDSIQIDVKFYDSHFTATPVFEPGDNSRINKASWICLDGPSIANVLEDEPYSLAKHLANYTNVRADHDNELARVLLYAHDNSSKPVDSHEFDLYSDWYKALFGRRPGSWNDIETALTKGDK